MLHAIVIKRPFSPFFSGPGVLRQPLTPPNSDDAKNLFSSFKKCKDDKVVDNGDNNANPVSNPAKTAAATAETAEAAEAKGAKATTNGVTAAVVEKSNGFAAAPAAAAAKSVLSAAEEEGSPAKARVETTKV